MFRGMFPIRMYAGRHGHLFLSPSGPSCIFMSASGSGLFLRNVLRLHRRGCMVLMVYSHCPKVMARLIGLLTSRVDL